MLKENTYGSSIVYNDRLVQTFFLLAAISNYQL
jgi:hypothetical protein